MTARARFALLLPALLGVAACVDAPATGDRVPATSVRDSAGVRLVATGFVRASLAADERLTLRDTLLDASRDGEVLTGLASVQPLADGSLLAYTTTGPALLHVRPPSGPLTRPRLDTLGHAGFAPGEYGEQGTLLPFLPDTALVWDREAGRLTRVAAEGLGATSLIDYPIARLASIAGVFADGSALGYTIAPPAVQGTGLSRAPAALLRFAPAGEMRDTFAAIRGPERVVQRGRLSRSEEPTLRTGSVPYARSTLVAVGPAHVVLLDTDGCHVEWRDTTGALTQRLDLRCVVDVVTDQTREQFRQELLARARTGSDSLLRDRIARTASFPPARATMAALRTDAARRAWLQLPADADSAMLVWWVFGGDGLPLARVGAPKPWTIVAIEDTTVVLATTDREDALPIVVRAPLPAALHAPLRDLWRDLARPPLTDR